MLNRTWEQIRTELENHRVLRSPNNGKVYRVLSIDDNAINVQRVDTGFGVFLIGSNLIAWGWFLASTLLLLGALFALAASWTIVGALWIWWTYEDRNFLVSDDYSMALMIPGVGFSVGSVGVLFGRGSARNRLREHVKSTEGLREFMLEVERKGGVADYPVKSPKMNVAWRATDKGVLGARGYGDREGVRVRLTRQGRRLARKIRSQTGKEPEPPAWAAGVRATNARQKTSKARQVISQLKEMAEGALETCLNVVVFLWLMSAMISLIVGSLFAVLYLMYMFFFVYLSGLSW